MTAHNTWVFNRKFGDAHNREWRLHVVFVICAFAAMANAEGTPPRTTVVAAGGSVLTYQGLFAPPEAEALFRELEKTVPFAWTTYDLPAEGGAQEILLPSDEKETKPVVVRSPRRMAWFADEPSWTYRFSQNHNPGLAPHAWAHVPTLSAIKAAVQGATGVDFNSCLVNIYTTTAEHADWHSDDDPWREFVC